MFRNYEAWLTQVPQRIQSDPLWSFVTYRKALFLSDLAWFDSEKFLNDSRGNGLAWQLVNSSGSVPANIEEGYGRGYGKDYARFLRIALGLAREAKGWYFRGRHMLDKTVVEHRMDLIDEIIKNLVITADQQRQR
ncbi:MAG: four helix bundle protein [Chloroflexota bacterium]